MTIPLSNGSGTDSMIQTTAGPGTASGTGSIAFGTGTTSDHTNSFAWGTDSRAQGDNATAWGASIASGTSSTSFGNNTIATGANATAWGDGSTAGGSSATAWGAATAEGDYGTAWGHQTTANAQYSTTWGDNTHATGVTSTVFGRAAVVGNESGTVDGKGDHSVAIGFGDGTGSGALPNVKGVGSLGLFFQGQNGYSITDDNVAVSVGANWLIDPNNGATYLTPRATLDVGNSTDSILLPTGTTAQRPSSPVDGMIRYNTTVPGVDMRIAGSWVNLSGTGPFTSEFISSTLTLPGLATEVSVAHGLGGKPKLVRLVLICTSADQGYSVGDELDMIGTGAAGVFAANVGAVTSSDATNINVSTLPNGTSPFAGILKGGTSGGSTYFTSASWGMKIYAWK
jgi:hypothetical protein